MRTRVLSLTLLACALVGASAAADNRVGVNAAIRNTVQEKEAGPGALHPAVLRAPVALGDTVVSGSDSALQMLLIDHSVFTVGANARVTIDRFVYDPDRGTSDIAASVATGAFRFMSGRSLHGFGADAINTPVASIGVRGTMLEGVVGPGAVQVLSGEPRLPPFNGDPANLNLIVLNGPGKNSQGFDTPGAIDVTAGGTTVTINHPGQAVVVFGPGQPPFGPFNLSDGAFARLSALLRTTPTGPEDEGPHTGSAGAQSGDTASVGSTGGDPYNKQTNGLNLSPPHRVDDNVGR